MLGRGNSDEIGVTDDTLIFEFLSTYVY